MTIDTSSTRAALLGAVVASGLALTGCGAHRPQTLLARADTICTAAVARHDAGTFPVANFDPEHPRARDLPSVGAYLARYGAAAATAARLESLPTPASRATDWTTLRTLLDQVVRNVRQQIAAARRSDVADFEKTVQRSRSLATRVDAAATKVGFTQGSPCRKVFG